MALIVATRSLDPLAMATAEGRGSLEQSRQFHWRVASRVGGGMARQATCQGVTQVEQVRVSSGGSVALQRMKAPSPSQGSWMVLCTMVKGNEGEAGGCLSTTVATCLSCLNSSLALRLQLQVHLTLCTVTRHLLLELSSPHRDPCSSASDSPQALDDSGYLPKLPQLVSSSKAPTPSPPYLMHSDETSTA
ncbi:hypothetical protein SLEP1_g17163 [Rubroshorea leprosula]|uniref:Uncharacterized protein n=1 Tax=Rubroshorea leprosula TaxID=152421 RepID=A0AAV5ITD1_9ROSI|nr:hypothetical protein SLEP1_g17163 [Rubroshorea leprosula]